MAALSSAAVSSLVAGDILEAQKELCSDLTPVDSGEKIRALLADERLPEHKVQLVVDSVRSTEHLNAALSAACSGSLASAALPLRASQVLLFLSLVPLILLGRIGIKR